MCLHIRHLIQYLLGHSGPNLSIKCSGQIYPSSPITIRNPQIFEGLSIKILKFYDENLVIILKFSSLFHFGIFHFKYLLKQDIK